MHTTTVEEEVKMLQCSLKGFIKFRKPFVKWKTRYLFHKLDIGTYTEDIRPMVEL